MKKTIRFKTKVQMYNVHKILSKTSVLDIDHLLPRKNVIIFGEKFMTLTVNF